MESMAGNLSIFVITRPNFVVAFNPSASMLELRAGCFSTLLMISLSFIQNGDGLKSVEDSIRFATAA